MKKNGENSASLETLSSIAKCYKELGDYRNALDIDKKCYEKRSIILGKTAFYTMYSLYNVVLDYLALGDDENVFSLSEYGYQILFNNGEAWDTRHSLWLDLLSGLYRNIKYCYDKAYDIDRKRYSFYIKEYGDDSRETLEALSDMASDLYELKLYSDALELDLRHYNKSRDCLGEYDEDTVKDLLRISQDYSGLGRYSESNKYAMAYLSQCDKSDENSKNVLSAYRSLIIGFNKTNDLRNSLKYAEIAFNYAFKKYGENDSVTILFLSLLRSATKEIGNSYQKLAIYDEKLFKYYLSKDGSDSKDTIFYLANLVNDYEVLGDKGKMYAYLALFEQFTKSGEK